MVGCMCGTKIRLSASTCDRRLRGFGMSTHAHGWARVRRAVGILLVASVLGSTPASGQPESLSGRSPRRTSQGRVRHHAIQWCGERLVRDVSRRGDRGVGGGPSRWAGCQRHQRPRHRDRRRSACALTRPDGLPPHRPRPGRWQGLVWRRFEWSATVEPVWFQRSMAPCHASRMSGSTTRSL